MLGQDVYVLGYPHGIGSETGELNYTRSLPFVKRAVMSAWNDAPSIYWLDSYVTDGFSGSPVISFPPEMRDSDCSVFAIVSGYRFVPDPVLVDDKEMSVEMSVGDEPSPVYVKQNTGIAACYDIKYALELIHHNPIGCELQQRS